MSERSSAMKRIAWYASLVLFAAIAFASLHGTAQAAPACQMNQSSLADLIVNYDPPLATAGTTMTVNSGTLTFTCSGLGSGNASHVYVLVSGSTAASYSTPFLTGPNAFQLAYTLCIPGSATCNGTTNVWNKTLTSAYKTTQGVNGVNTIPSFLIFLGKQDAFVGTTADYTGNLFFSFFCGEGGSQAAC
jgi:hypothetical protein